MIFHRNAIPYIYSYFMPVFTLTLFGAASFFISPASIPGRVGLLLTIELVMMNLYISVRVCILYTNLDMYFSNFSCRFLNPNLNCSNDLRNLQEQLKAFCFKNSSDLSLFETKFHFYSHKLLF